MFVERVLEPRLHDGHGEIAAGPLEHGAQRVGRASEPAGHRVRMVDGDELRVDVVHRGQQLLGTCQLAGAEPVEDVAPQLRRRLG